MTEPKHTAVYCAALLAATAVVATGQATIGDILQVLPALAVHRRPNAL